MDLLIFDLDGTLVDSRLDLANAVNATRATWACRRSTNERVYSYVGNGAPRADPPRSGRPGQRSRGPGGARVLPGVLPRARSGPHHALSRRAESLDRLRAAGKRMAVLTNKPVRMSRAIVEGLGVGGHFFRVYGGNSFEFKKPNPIGVEALMRGSRRRARPHPHGRRQLRGRPTARNAGMRCCGVTYGFQPETLADPAPDLLVDRMESWPTGSSTEKEA